MTAALAAEVAAYIDAHAGEVDEHGRRLVVRNGHHHQREVLTAAGAVSVTAPRVNDKRIDADTGERQRFSSAILPAWARKSPQVSEVLPLLYLHSLSTSDFGPALEQFLGSGAGLSATTITRLTSQWQDEAKAFGGRDLSGTDYVYLWVDGIHLKVRLDQEKLCLLVMIGVRSDGRKELSIWRAPSRTISSSNDRDLPASSLDESESWTTVSMGVPSRTSAPTPALDQTYVNFQIILGKVRPTHAASPRLIHRF